MTEYIKKSLETPSGFNAECWTVIGVWIDLKANCAVITFEGYKDFQAKIEGKNPIHMMDIKISDLEVFAIFSSVHDTIVNCILNHPSFSGGKLEIVEEVI